MSGEKVAIIGGGIAGLYAAWRLQKLERDFEVSVYEAERRIGGRIDTAKFGVREKESGDPPTALKAELGAMRFPNSHRLLLNLCEKLKIQSLDKATKPEAWRGPFELKSLYHLRGTTLSEECFRRGEIPYRVRPEEKGKTPAGLLEYAIFRMLRKMIDDYAAKGRRSDAERLRFLKAFRKKLEDHEVIPAKSWMKFIQNDYEFAGIPLRNIGFWNVLKHFLSSEAFLLVHDGFGFLSVISNWNAPEAFKWLLTDFSPHLRLQTLPGGLSQIVERLEEELRCGGGSVIEWERSLRGVHLDRQAKNFRLDFTKGGSVRADHVVFAMPPNALRRIRLFDGDDELEPDVETAWKQLIHCSRPHRLAKIVLAYEEPWWQHTRVPGAESGRLFTDLPMRQIHYFGPQWLAENKWVDKASGLSLVMVYNDSHYEAFWRTFHVHDKVYRTSVIANAEHPDRTLGLRPESIGDRAFSFWGPRKMKEHCGWALTATEDELKKIDDADGDDYEVRHRMEEKVRAQLTELHDYEVPMAIGGVYRDWSDEGGWHTWEPFVDVPAVKDVILQPFYDDGKLSMRRCGSDIAKAQRLRLYVCGEAYAWEQGWIEGALMTAERVAAEISGRYKKPDWFREDEDPLAFGKYMYAELSGEEREKVDISDKAGTPDHSDPKERRDSIHMDEDRESE